MRYNIQWCRGLYKDSTTGSPTMPPPLIRPRTSTTPWLTSPRSALASSSRENPTLSQTRSSPNASTRASPSSHSSRTERGRHGCCERDDDVNGAPTSPLLVAIELVMITMSADYFTPSRIVGASS
jgi:hypothetical protein